MDKEDYDDMVQSILFIYQKVVCSACKYDLEIIDKEWDDSTGTAILYVRPCGCCLESAKQEVGQQKDCEEEEIVP